MRLVAKKFTVKVTKVIKVLLNIGKNEEGQDMKYEYQMVQIPPNISVTSKSNHMNAAANYLQKVVDEYADDGWEFHRVDQIGIHTKPGCLAGLFGSKAELTYYYVISFKRLAKNA